VELVMVHGPPPSHQSGDASREAAAEDEDIHLVRATYFSSLMDAPSDGAADRVTAVVLDGPVVQTLARRAAAGVDLIVMATHARSGVHRAIAGSVADEVLRAAPCAVLLAPGVQPPDA
jgi:nucleotide-binding universal stress UspA family protein